jgi:hypothetical protein
VIAENGREFGRIDRAHVSAQFLGGAAVGADANERYSGIIVRGLQRERCGSARMNPDARKAHRAAKRRLSARSHAPPTFSASLAATPDQAPRRPRVGLPGRIVFRKRGLLKLPRYRLILTPCAPNINLAVRKDQFTVSYQLLPRIGGFRPPFGQKDRAQPLGKPAQTLLIREDVRLQTCERPRRRRSHRKSKFL